MWCYILAQDYSKFLEQYTFLDEYAEDIILKKIKDCYFLPRLFYKNYPSQYLKLYPGKKSFNPCLLPDRIDSLIELRKKQTPIVDTIMNVYNQQGHVNGIIKAYPGIGKTVISIHLACLIGYKTAIVVDNTDLMEQWADEIRSKTTTVSSDIGFVRGKKFDKDCPFLIMSVQTLFRKVEKDLNNFYKLIQAEQIGLVFFDEVHSVSSTTKYAKASLLFQTPNIIGLSATPYHSGLQDILMKNTVGEILYETNDYELQPNYYLVRYNSGLDTKKFKRAFFIQDFIGKKTIYDGQIINSTNYFDIITILVKKLIEQKYVVMILGMTKEQVRKISYVLQMNGIENRRYYGDEREIDKDTDNVIVATYKFCGKGFNFKRLSALILATPLFGKKSLIQVTGRILRVTQHKKPPIVFDLYDNVFDQLFGNKWLNIKKQIIKNEFNIEPDELNMGILVDDVNI